MSHAININNSKYGRDTQPWYRYGWPWFLISIPFVSVILGSMMLYLALQTNNSLVVDDYYKEGKAFNLRIERDRVAALLGLTATMEVSSEGLIVQLSKQVPQLPPSLQAQATESHKTFVEPAKLELRWVHVTQAEKDIAVSLRSIGGGRYLSAGATFPQDGLFRTHIQPSVDSQWRLVSAEPVAFENQPVVRVVAPKASQVFTEILFE